MNGFAFDTAGSTRPSCGCGGGCAQCQGRPWEGASQAGRLPINQLARRSLSTALAHAQHGRFEAEKIIAVSPNLRYSFGRPMALLEVKNAPAGSEYAIQGQPWLYKIYHRDRPDYAWYLGQTFNLRRRIREHINAKGPRIAAALAAHGGGDLVTQAARHLDVNRRQRDAATPAVRRSLRKEEEVFDDVLRTLGPAMFRIRAAKVEQKWRGQWIKASQAALISAEKDLHSQGVARGNAWSNQRFEAGLTARQLVRLAHAALADAVSAGGPAPAALLPRAEALGYRHRYFSTALQALSGDVGRARAQVVEGRPDGAGRRLWRIHVNGRFAGTIAGRAFDNGQERFKALPG